MASPSQPNVVLDGLPYVEDTHEDYEQYALSLIEQDMQSTLSPPKLPAAPDLHLRTSLMRTSYQELDQGGKSDGDDTIEWNMSNEFVGKPSSDNPDEWREAVEKARVAYETERLRGEALSVDKSGSSEVWKAHVEDKTHNMEALSAQTTRQRQQVEEINLARSQQQSAAGQELRILEQKHSDALKKRWHLSKAIQALEREIS